MVVKHANIDDFDYAEDLLAMIDDLLLSDKQKRVLLHKLQNLVDEIYEEAFEEGRDNG